LEARRLWVQSQLRQRTPSNLQHAIPLQQMSHNCTTAVAGNATKCDAKMLYDQSGHTRKTT